jgi:hypothetical protein
VPKRDRGQAGAGAQAEGGAGRYVLEHGHLDATATSFRLCTSALLSSGTWRHSFEYALLVGIIISLLFFLILCVPICRISRGTH